MAQRNNKHQSKFEEKVIQVNRVAKKTKGGDQMSFSVLMVVGDRQGKVGVGLGKARGVVDAIKKGVRKAKDKMMPVPIDGATIPFKMEAKYGAGHVLLKPAVEGTGVVAGGPVRAVVEAAGIKDISAKILGSDNQASSVYATIEALKKINRIVEVRDITLHSDYDSQSSSQTRPGPDHKKTNANSKSTQKKQTKKSKKNKKSSKAKKKTTQSNKKSQAKSAKTKSKKKTKKETNKSKKSALAKSKSKSSKD